MHSVSVCFVPVKTKFESKDFPLSHLRIVFFHFIFTFFSFSCIKQYDNCIRTEKLSPLIEKKIVDHKKSQFSYLWVGWQLEMPSSFRTSVHSLFCMRRLLKKLSNCEWNSYSYSNSTERFQTSNKEWEPIHEI